MPQVNVFGSYGLCIWKMQQRCNQQLYNATDACYTQQKEYGKTVNWIMVDFPDQGVSPFTAVETARKLNLVNIEYYLGTNSTPPTSQPPEGLCTKSKIRPEPPTFPPAQTTCEALDQISKPLVGIFECTYNPDQCTKLMCSADFFQTGRAGFELF